MNKMITSPYLVEHNSISEAWCRTLEHIIDCPGSEITPLVVSLTEFNETPSFRSALDAYLKKNNKAKIHTVAETIFPESLYVLNGFDRHKFYQGFLEILPRIKKIDASSNGRGTYFERFTCFIVVEKLDSLKKWEGQQLLNTIAEKNNV